jgi:hypothetical protein
MKTPSSSTFKSPVYKSPKKHLNPYRRSKYSPEYLVELLYSPVNPPTPVTPTFYIYETPKKPPRKKKVINFALLMSRGYDIDYTLPIPPRESSSFLHWFTYIQEEHRPQHISYHILSFMTAHDIGMLDIALLNAMNVRDLFQRGWSICKPLLSLDYGHFIGHPKGLPFYESVDFFDTPEHMFRCSESLFCRYFHYLYNPNYKLSFLFQSCTSVEECFEKFARFIKDPDIVVFKFPKLPIEVQGDAFFTSY